jgi:predicted metalloprotease with PDZ domain
MVNDKFIQFSIDLNQGQKHLFNISLQLDCASRNQVLSMPVWAPGSYMVREFSQHIIEINAYSENEKIKIDKVNKNTFITNNTTNNLRINYLIYAFDSSIRAAFIDDLQAFFNGTSLFLRPHEILDLKYKINILKPNEKKYSNWQVATVLNSVNVDEQGFGTYVALDYDTLVDCPVQISPMKRLNFNVCNTEHEIVLVSDVRNFNESRLKKDLALLCKTQINIFGDTPPFKNYLFIARFEEGGFGGLEHMNSSMLLCNPYALPQDEISEPDVNYRSFLSLCSHEYFHAYNVKRIKPIEFCPYNYEEESYTKMLWLFEGFTAYYDDLMLKKASLISAESYLSLLAKNISNLLKNPGRKMQNLAESSFDTWIKFYRPHENSHNTNISYYLKGSLLALFIDLTIRINTQHKKSLDDVMNYCFLNHGNQTGISEEIFLSVLKEIGLINIQELKEDFIYGLKELPLSSMLDKFGIETIFSIEDESVSSSLGLKIKFDHQRAFVQSVDYNWPATNAGLSPNDEIISINKIRIDEKNYHDMLVSLKPEQQIEILYARKKQVFSTVLTTAHKPQDSCKLVIKKSISPEEKNALGQWLKI